MTYYPPTLPPPPFRSVDWCPNCEDYYGTVSGVELSCAVQHSPGSCCHYGEKLLDVSAADCYLGTACQAVRRDSPTEAS